MEALKIQKATYQDLIDLPPQMVGEIIGGELYASPRPAFAHATVASELGSDLIGPFRRGRGGPGGWWILDEPELHFDEDVLVPDLAGWRRERLPDPQRLTFSTVAPDWACEVLSPRTRRLDRALKMGVYAREGVSWLWLLDPSTRSLEAYRLENGRWSLLGTWFDGDRVRVEPFDAIELDLLPLWGEDRKE